MKKIDSRKNFLILHTINFIGDLILLIPSMRKIRSLEPDSNLILVCRKGLGSFFLKMNLVDQVYEVIKKDNSSYRRAFEQIKDIFFECIFCHQEFLRTALFAMKLKAKRKVGFKKWWNFFIFDTRIPIQKGLPESLRQMSLFASLDKETKESIHIFYTQKYLPFLKAYQSEKNWSYNKVKKKGTHPKSMIKRNSIIEKNRFIQNKKIQSFHLREDIFCWPENFFIPSWASLSLKFDLLKKDLSLNQKIKKYEKRKKKRIFLAPRSGPSTKVWHWSGFAKIGKRLAVEGWEVLLVGTEKEKEYIEKIAHFIPGSKNLAGTTDVYELIGLFLTGSALIANDSGALHMASVVELPTVLVLGPSDLRFRFLPWQDHWRVVKRNFKCSPCYNQRGWTPASFCPLGTHHCMNEINIESVHLALKDLLKNKKT